MLKSGRIIAHFKHFGKSAESYKNDELFARRYLNPRYLLLLLSPALVAAHDFFNGRNL
jgi:hypothetical protein